MKSLGDMDEQELKGEMDYVCNMIRASLPPQTGFIVLATPFGGKVAQYASNVDRESGAAWMKETLERWGSGDHVPR